MFALHMFDALIECDASFTYHLADGSDVVEHRNEPHEDVASQPV